MANYPNYDLFGKRPADTFRNLVQFNETASNLVDSYGDDLPQLAITASVEGTSSWANNAVSASWAPDQTVTVNSASWASQSLSASWAPFTQTQQASASWASQSLSSIVATSSFYADGATTATQSFDALWATQSLLSNNSVSASWASQSLNCGVATASLWASSSLSSSYVESASWAPQQQDISVNSITASYISSSGEVIVPDPINPQNAVTKYYVDNINPQGLQAYFRADLDDSLPEYYQMHDLSVPLSASANTITTTNVSASQYIFSFVSFGVGVTNINAGNFNVHFHAWFTGGGSAALSVVPEFWLRSGSVETFVADEAPIVLDQTVNKEYTGQITLTSSIVTNPTDRAIVKFRVATQNQTPDAFMRVDGQTSAGVVIPVPSSNFVLKAGDSMTGNLTSTGFTGSLFGTASVAVSAISASWAPDPTVTVVSASWASASLSTSFVYPLYQEVSMYGPTNVGDTTPYTSLTVVGREGWPARIIQGGSFVTQSVRPVLYVYRDLDQSQAQVTPLLQLRTMETGSLAPLMVASNDVSDVFTIDYSGSITASGLFGTASYATNAISASYSMTASALTPSSGLTTNVYISASNGDITMSFVNGLLISVT